MKEKNPEESLIKNLQTTKQILLLDIDMDEREFRRYINPIISDNRGISIEDAKNQQRIRGIEVFLFYAKIGEDIREIAKLKA